MTPDFDFQSLKGKRILVADDLQDTQALASLFLRKFGAEVDLAASGQEVINKALESDYDAILMDVHMPEVDGLTATEKLRSLGFRKPILMMTADCRNGLKERAFAIGATSYLSKPVSWIEMIHAIEKFCLTRKPSEPKTFHLQ